MWLSFLLLFTVFRLFSCSYIYIFLQHGFFPLHSCCSNFPMIFILLYVFGFVVTLFFLLINGFFLNTTSLLCSFRFWVLSFRVPSSCLSLPARLSPFFFCFPNRSLIPFVSTFICFSFFLKLHYPSQFSSLPMFLLFLRLQT